MKHGYGQWPWISSEYGIPVILRDRRLTVSSSLPCCVPFSRRFRVELGRNANFARSHKFPTTFDIAGKTCIIRYLSGSLRISPPRKKRPHCYIRKTIEHRAVNASITREWRRFFFPPEIREDYSVLRNAVAKRFGSEAVTILLFTW